MKDCFERPENTLKSSKSSKCCSYALLSDTTERWRTSTTRFQGAADCCSLVTCNLEVLQSIPLMFVLCHFIVSLHTAHGCPV